MSNTQTLQITGMSCAACAGRVERALRKVEGVSAADVNLATETARIELQPSTPIERLLDAVEKAGYGAQLPRPEFKPEPPPPLWPAVTALVLSLPLLLPMLLGLPMLPGWAQLVLSAVVLFGFGHRFFSGAARALRHGSSTMDVLVALGTSAAFSLSCWNLWRHGDAHATPLYFESAALIVGFVLLGKTLEARARSSTTAAIRSLQALQPEVAQVEREGRIVELPLAQLQVGDLLIVRPGERVPADSRVESGLSEVNEALITGESLPVHKQPGARLIGGSINGDGLLRARCTALGAESTLARIARMVEEAQGAKAPIQRLVDRICAVFVPAVLAAALLTLLGWGVASSNWEMALLNAVSVLVIACPCALGLATPAALMAGMGAAARCGILIRDAEALDLAHGLKTVAFDKTGTLTEGRPQLVHVDGGPEALALAGALAAGSAHPLAHAIRAASQDLQLPHLDGITAHPGRGVSAQLRGEPVALCSPRWLEERGIAIPQERLGHWQAQGLTFSWLTRGEQVLGLLVFGDVIKGHAAACIRSLRALGLRTVLISGDNRAAVEALTRQLGIDESHAEVLPEDKARIVTELRAQGPVAMVGDGVNDAPALAAADVGLAMGNGAEAAMAAAGITLMHGDPALVPEALMIARRIRNKIRQNLAWAFVFNAVGIPLAAFGLLSPALAGGAMALSSVCVLSNALLLARQVQAAHQ